MSLWNGAALSQTGQIQVDFFSFIIRKVEASKHCRCVHVLARDGIDILILPSCKRNVHTSISSIFLQVYHPFFKGAWLVVLSIYVPLVVFQPYRDLEVGDNQFLKL